MTNEAEETLLYVWDSWAPEMLVKGQKIKFAGDNPALWRVRKYLRDHELIDENGIPRGGVVF